MNDDFVALTHCYFCGEADKILISKFPGRPNRAIREAHGKVIDMDPCNKCKEHMKLGIMLLVIDEEKSEPNWNKPPHGAERFIPNPHCTGHMCVITQDTAERMMSNNPDALEFALKHRWMFIDTKAAEQFGLLKEITRLETKKKPDKNAHERPV